MYSLKRLGVAEHLPCTGQSPTKAKAASQGSILSFSLDVQVHLTPYISACAWPTPDISRATFIVPTAPIKG